MDSDPHRQARFMAVAAEVYGPLQRYFARRSPPEDAAELLNETLTVLWRRLDHVPATAPLPYSYGIARRCLANQRRGDQRRLRLVERIASRRIDDAPDPATAIDDSDPELAAALLSLTPAEREIVHLWAWERLEPREIAVAVDATPNAVSVALTRARRKIGAQLERPEHIARQDPSPPGHNVSGRAGEPEDGQR